MRNLIFFCFLIFCSCSQSNNNKNDQLLNSLDTASPYQARKTVQKPDTTNQIIYDFMKMVVSNRKLDLSYGLTLEPEPRCDLSNDDRILLKTLLIDKTKKKKDSAHDWETDTITVYSLEPTKCLTEGDLKSMFEQRQRLSNFEWDNSRLGFTLANRKNWYCFSIPIFSIDKNKAVMMIRDLCEGLCGTGETLLFIKQNGNWTSESMGQWVH